MGSLVGRQVGPLGHEPSDVVTIHRGLEDPGCRSQLAGAHADAVHLDVIRVTVGAALVVDRQDVGLFVEEHARETLRSLVDVGAREALGRVVRRFASHARVVVPEELDAVDAEYPSSVHRFLDAAIGKCLARGESVAWRFAEFASRRDDENDTMSLGFRGAIVPPVAIASSSGWAWNETSVCDRARGTVGDPLRESLPRPTRCRV